MNKKTILSIISIAFIMLIVSFGVNAATPAQYGLMEGNLISATGSSDPDVYIVNEQGYKRLFLNPVIFSMYAHLGGFANVKTVSSQTRDAFPTSGLFRVVNTQRVYGIEVTGEDTAVLHWVNIPNDPYGTEVLRQDPNFFKKVFIINQSEFNWYQKGYDYTALSQVPIYSRTVPSVSLLSPSFGPVGTSVAIIGSGFSLSDNTINFGTNVIRGVTSYNGSSLVFTVPTYTSPACLYSTPPCYMDQGYITAGNYSVSVSNSGGTSNATSFNVTSPIQANLTIQTLSLSSVTIGSGYSASIYAYGGNDSYVWSVISGALPPGLNMINAMCILAPCKAPMAISGTPTVAGNYTFTVAVYSGSQSAYKEFTISVLPISTLPVIYSLSSYSGLVGSTVTINGNNFRPTGNKIKFGNLGSENNPSYSLNSSDGRTIIFTIPPSNYYVCWDSVPVCYTPAVMTQPGVYAVSVINSYGTSNSLTYTVTSPGSLVPTIISLSTTSGVVGSSVTINGTNFLSDANRVKFGDLGSENNPSYSLRSSDGRTIVFTVPSSNYYACWDEFPACRIASQATLPGSYGVSVINANGTSNTAGFIVN